VTVVLVVGLNRSVLERLAPVFSESDGRNAPSATRSPERVVVTDDAACTITGLTFTARATTSSSVNESRGTACACSNPGAAIMAATSNTSFFTIPSP
jgi:hypothetical protein